MHDELSQKRPQDEETRGSESTPVFFQSGKRNKSTSQAKLDLVGGALAVVPGAGQDRHAVHTPACQRGHLRVQNVHGLGHMQSVQVDRIPFEHLCAHAGEAGSGGLAGGRAR